MIPGNCSILCLSSTLTIHFQDHVLHLISSLWMNCTLCGGLHQAFVMIPQLWALAQGYVCSHTGVASNLPKGVFHLLSHAQRYTVFNK